MLFRIFRSFWCGVVKRLSWNQLWRSLVELWAVDCSPLLQLKSDCTRDNLLKFLVIVTKIRFEQKIFYKKAYFVLRGRKLFVKRKKFTKNYTIFIVFTFVPGNSHSGNSHEDTSIASAGSFIKGGIDLILKICLICHTKCSFSVQYTKYNALFPRFFLADVWH